MELSPFEGTIHFTASAASGAILSAVNQVLRRERNKFTRGHKVSTFHGASGREGPAGVARALELDFCDGTSGNPVDRVFISGFVGSIGSFLNAIEG